MIQPLLDHIQSIVPTATDDDIESFVAMFQVRTLRKKEIFLRQGTICQYEGFVLEGCLRNYSINEEGNETTTRFRFENSWAGNPTSYVKYAFVLRGIAHDHSRYKLLELSLSAETRYRNMLALHPK